MPRIARVVAPGYPHHITQRGNRRQRTFFVDEDYRLYLDLIGEWCARFSVEIWSYCLMPNHVHLIAVPGTEAGLRAAIGEAHRRYTSRINAREGWTGHLWQGRFASYVMDERYLLAAARYIELNPVRAGLAAAPSGYQWSSAKAHLLGCGDPVARFERLDEIAGDWGAFMQKPLSEAEMRKLRGHSSTGRPLGGEKFISGLERQLGRVLARQRPGPKPA